MRARCNVRWRSPLVLGCDRIRRDIHQLINRANPWDHMPFMAREHSVDVRTQHRTVADLVIVDGLTTNSGKPDPRANSSAVCHIDHTIGSVE